MDIGGSYRARSPMIPSISATVAASSATPDAPALSSTCSGRVAPMIAAATFSSRSTQASASCARVRPSPSAIGLSCWTRSRRTSSRLRSMNWFIRSCVARLLAGQVLAGEDALGERRPDDLRDAELLRGGDDVALRPAPDEGVLRLARDEMLDAGHRLRLADLVLRPLAEAEPA